LSLAKQIEINEEYIDQKLVCEQSNYIDIQLQKKLKFRQLQNQLKLV